MNGLANRLNSGFGAEASVRFRIGPAVMDSTHRDELRSFRWRNPTCHPDSSTKMQEKLVRGRLDVKLGILA